MLWRMKRAFLIDTDTASDDAVALIWRCGIPMWRWWDYCCSWNVGLRRLAECDLYDGALRSSVPVFVGRRTLDAGALERGPVSWPGWIGVTVSRAAADAGEDGRRRRRFVELVERIRNCDVTLGPSDECGTGLCRAAGDCEER